MASEWLMCFFLLPEDKFRKVLNHEPVLSLEISSCLISAVDNHLLFEGIHQPACKH